MNKTIICTVCNKEFSVPNWRVGKAKFCSYDCYNIARKTDKSYDKPRICDGCGKEFLPTQWYQKYCNQECFYKSTKKSKIVKCKQCGKDFMQVRQKQQFCSRACSYKSPSRKSTSKKPKSNNLDNLWSKKVKELAGNKCEYCGKTEGLNSHHIFSRSNKRVRWDTDNGVSVCVLHHVFGLFSAHKSPIEFAEWLKEYRGLEWYNNLREKAKFEEKYVKLTESKRQEIRKELEIKKH